MLVYYTGWLNAKAGRLADRSGRRDRMLKSGTVPPKTGRMVSLSLRKDIKGVQQGLQKLHKKFDCFCSLLVIFKKFYILKTTLNHQNRTKIQKTLLDSFKSSSNG